MTRRRKETLRALSDAEHEVLLPISRSHSEPASDVAHAKGLLAAAEGRTYTQAAALAGRKTGDTVARWVSAFNAQGLAALVRRQGGGPARKYGQAERARILAEARRQPTPEQDGTASWSLPLLCRALRRAADGLPTVSEDTIRTVLLESGFRWQRTRSWRQTGQGVRQRRSGPVEVRDPDAEPKKS